MTRKANRGFTLVEVLLAMAIFAIGGVSILALFLANSTRAARAADRNRAVEIASSVRAALETAMIAPPVVQAGSGSQKDRLYQLALPQFTLDAPAVQATSSPTTETPVYYFRLPTEPFVGGAKPPGQYTVLPRELLDITGKALKVANGEPKAWYFRTTPLSRRTEKELGPTSDRDEREAYSFNFFIRRSVARSDIESSGRGATRSLLEGLYVVQLRVYKGYDEQGQNTPIEEFTFYLTATQ